MAKQPPAKPDLIAAIATAPGRGGVGVVRVSGPDIVPLAAAMLGRLPAARHATLCRFLDGEGRVIDEGIALRFTAPHSFTGDNVLELQGHGGPVVLGLILLTSRGGRLVAAVKSAPEYKFYALPGGPPYRPGMVRVAEGGGAIEMEIWELPAREFGSFVAGIPAPLGIGMVKLADGGWVQGFVCEAAAITDAEDITALGSWLDYLARRSISSASGSQGYNQNR